MASRSYAGRRQNPATFGTGVVLTLAALFLVAPGAANRLTDSALRISVAVTTKLSQVFVEHVFSNVSPAAPADRQPAPRPTSSR